MDGETIQFLIDNNLDSLVGTFTENHIDYSILSVLSEKDVDELVKPLGLKIRLKSALKTLRIDLDETSSSQNCDLSKSISDASTLIIDGSDDLSLVLDNKSSVIPAPSHQSIAEISVKTLSMLQEDDSVNIVSQEDHESFPPSKVLRKSDFFVDNLTVEELLESRAKGRNILRLFREKGFDSKGRRVLVELIVDALLDRHSSVRSDMLREVATEIVSLFPSESIEIYYSYNPTISKNPRGKLVDKYKSERGYRKRNTSQGSSKVENATTTICDNSEVLAHIKWLQHSQEPWDKVQSLWVKTYDSRKSDFASNQTLPQIFKKWPLLKHRAGYTLVSIHFGAVNFRFIF